MEMETLKKLGLTTNEAKIYSEIFNRGSTSCGRLAQIMGLNRSNLYKNLNKLCEMGLLVKQQIEIGPHYYYAVDLERALYSLAKYQYSIVRLLIEQQRQLRQGRQRPHDRHRPRANV